MILASMIILAGVACTKESTQAVTKKASLETLETDRTVRFILYTEKDLSADNKDITFSLFIRSHTKVLLDSIVVSMKIKDIPRIGNKLIFEKKVVDDGQSLAAGFRYAIDNVGNSWYMDTCRADEKLKVIDFFVSIRLTCSKNSNKRRTKKRRYAA